ILTGERRIGAHVVLRRQAHVDGIAGLHAGLRELVAIFPIYTSDEVAFLVQDSSCLTRDDEVGEKIVCHGLLASLLGDLLVPQPGPLQIRKLVTVRSIWFRQTSGVTRILQSWG